jgi:predicted cupin superfamily sugar epimerase
MSADEIIALLGLEPHPEGGFYRETWRHRPAGEERGVGTSIYFLLREGEMSRWHRVDATEIWHYYGGASLRLDVVEEGGEGMSHRLGPALADGEQPQFVVPAGAWQSAVSTGAWTLVGCTVSPAFSFDGFEMAPEGWSPPTWSRD